MYEEREQSPNHKLKYGSTPNLINDLKSSYPWVKKSIINHNNITQKKVLRIFNFPLSGGQSSTISLLSDDSNAGVSTGHSTDEETIVNSSTIYVEVSSITRKPPGVLITRPLPSTTIKREQLLLYITKLH